MKNRQKVFIATLLAVAGAFACKASAKFSADNVPGFGKTEVGVEVDAGNHTVKVEGDKNGPLKDGDCVKVTFLDGAGKPIGSAEGVAGKPIDAPEGTDDVVISPCDPPKPSGREELQVAALTEFAYRSVPVHLESGRGRYVDFTVAAYSREEADAVALEFLSAPVRAPAPVGVTTYSYVLSRLSAKGCSIAIFSQDRPQNLQLDFNGRAPANTRMRKIGGWYVSLIDIPLSQVNHSRFGANTNAVSYSLRAGNRDIQASIHLLVEP